MKFRGLSKGTNGLKRESDAAIVHGLFESACIGLGNEEPAAGEDLTLGDLWLGQEFFARARQGLFLVDNRHDNAQVEKRLARRFGDLVLGPTKEQYRLTLEGRPHGQEDAHEIYPMRARPQCHERFE